MKKLLLILTNMSVFLLFAIFYRYGGNVAIHMIPTIFIFSLLNVLFSKSRKDFLIWNLFLLISNIIGIIVNSILYFQNVYYDSLGEAVMVAEILVAIIYIGILTLIEYLVIKRFK